MHERPTDEARDLARAIDCLREPVRRALRRCGLPPADVDDATQEVMVRIAMRWPQLRSFEPDARAAYASRVAMGVAIDLRRRTTRRSRHDRETEVLEEPCETGPFEIVAARQILARIEARLSSMKARDRDVLILAGAFESTAPEVAEHLGIPSGTVASRLRRARAIARDAVHEPAGRFFDRIGAQRRSTP